MKITEKTLTMEQQQHWRKLTGDRMSEPCLPAGRQDLGGLKGLAKDKNILTRCRSLHNQLIKMADNNIRYHSGAGCFLIMNLALVVLFNNLASHTCTV
jgi:hypothetical protein